MSRRRPKSTRARHESRDGAMKNNDAVRKKRQKTLSR
jgi:hypothetical protein